MDIVQATRTTIKDNQLTDWLSDYPWLTGCLGNPNASVWFIGENPSLNGVINVNKRSPETEKTENLQWNSHAGDKLLREAMTDAGLKQGPVELNEGWNCYITNAIKEPEIVTERNLKKRNSDYWKVQAELWLPILQQQIDNGDPKVLVLLGGQSEKIIHYMIKLGLKVPATEKIHHYSYIMMRPESGTNRGPRHPDRIAEFKASIKSIAKKYSR
ncbi:hypothetical protein MAMP_00314 [Methylophaga aminisulfidivorans MP]|uniref:Uracil-DNA glycosylase-like domain-containing protein n=1 Tax=Methylophaga aminisulfidivorans MP TaxID=1026882 RepID=F5T1P2_9GAMM|nr:hypothetical protein MAMP_00314 [Methylophaga aminisulfidivorans MP]